MGLDLVEVVMRAEQKFGVRYPRPGPPLHTVGDMVGVIQRQLESRTILDRPHPTTTAFFRIRKVLLGLGIDRQRIRPQARLEVLLPPRLRPRAWRGFRSEGLQPRFLGVRGPTPQFGCLGAFAVLVLAGFACGKLLSGWSVLVGALLVVGLVLWSHLKWSRSLPSAYTTVWDMARDTGGSLWLPGFGPDDVFPVVRSLVAEATDVKLEDIKLESRFHEDLGIH